MTSGEPRTAVFLGLTIFTGCYTREHRYEPLDDVAPYSKAYSFEDCQKRCADVDGCFFFTWSGNHDNCHLTGDRSAVLVSTLAEGNPSTVVGPKTCVGEKSPIFSPTSLISS